MKKTMKNRNKELIKKGVRTHLVGFFVGIVGSMIVEMGLVISGETLIAHLLFWIIPVGFISEFWINEVYRK